MKLLNKISVLKIFPINFEQDEKWIIINSISQWDKYYMLRDALLTVDQSLTTFWKVSSDWLKEKVIYLHSLEHLGASGLRANVSYKLSQLSIWEETLRKKIRILLSLLSTNSYNRATVRFGFIFIWSVSTLNGFTSHLLLYLWLDINIPRNRYRYQDFYNFLVITPQLVRVESIYSASWSRWSKYKREISFRPAFPYSTE